MPCSRDRTTTDTHLVKRLLPPSLLALVFAFLAACTGFREVRTDVFRCPQPTEHQLAHTIAAHDVRTVASFRGSSKSALTERAATQAGARFVHIPMSATRRPSAATLLALWDLAEHAERPLLLHCRGGADRTGLASAIVVLHDTGDLAAARAQLDLIPYGHVAWTATGAMDEVLVAYGRHAATMSFPTWVREVYARDEGALSQ